MNIEYRLLDLQEGEEIPYKLLLLADPSKTLVDEYVARGVCYLAYIEDELVGEFVLIHTHPRTIEIVNIAVAEQHQGRGIGKALVRHAIEEAKRLNAASVEIGTGNTSLLQLRLYQQCGFRITGVDQDFFVRNYDEEIFEDGLQCRDMIRLRLDFL
ncbi:GNAT family N-acetyltransferase [Paenibacillus aceti]|uniref:N-acetyltransferase YvbK n=1 Tax=Paenibacillus aceti TaxID=1820010 RepID=A0ABQ1W0Y6_9BACL|nr:GNAT family N-acetyltransferase [Paenibacillus aceti]GGG07290.1 putative N-acetyltransferase YvbK [Paenibacillus aceti]